MGLVAAIAPPRAPLPVSGTAPTQAPPVSAEIVQRLQAQGVKADTAAIDLTPVTGALLELLEANKRGTTALPAADSSVESGGPG